MLDKYLSTFQSNFIHLDIARQILGQALRLVDATIFDALLLRKDLCSPHSAQELTSKLDPLTRWLTESAGTPWVGEPTAHLKMTRQALNLFVIPDASRMQLCTDPSFRGKTCPDLNTWQIRQLLTMYSPDDGQEKVPLHLLHQLSSYIGKHVRVLRCFVKTCKQR